MGNVAKLINKIELRKVEPSYHDGGANGGGGNVPGLHNGRRILYTAGYDGYGAESSEEVILRHKIELCLEEQRERLARALLLPSLKKGQPEFIRKVKSEERLLSAFRKSRVRHKRKVIPRFASI